jgi:GNAT superfamily N-acetyltransferase
MLTYFDKRSFQLPDNLKVETFHGAEQPDLLSQIETLRVAVWKATGFVIKPELAKETHWGDKWDSVCTHWAILNGDQVIGATRASVHPSVSESPYPEWFQNLSALPAKPVIYSSRLVIAPHYQRQGLGDFLDQKCVEFARAENACAILIDVPEYRIEPLLKRGFQLSSEPIQGILFPTMRFTGMVLKLEG